MMTPRRLHKEQRGKVPSKIGTARKLKTKRRGGRERLAKGKPHGSAMGGMRSWRKVWNEEGWKEALCRRVPELVAHERMSQVEKQNAQKKPRKLKGWSTEEMKNKANSFLEEDTEEMKKWSGMSQDKMDQCWRSLAERMEDEILDKYKVEDGKREAFKGISAQLKWRRVRRNKKNKITKWREN